MKWIIDMSDLRPMTAWMSNGRDTATFIPGTISSFSHGKRQGGVKYLPAIIKQSKKEKVIAVRKARSRHMRNIGYTYIKIANILGVSMTTIANDCM